MKKLAWTIIVLLGTFMQVQAENNEPYVFYTYGDGIDLKQVNDYPDHLLGDTIAKQLHAVKELYLVRYETKVGFSDSEIEVQKPDILNAVEKMDAYFKKTVKKGGMNKKEASGLFSKYLTVAYWAFYEETDAFEKALSKIKKSEELLAVFEKVQLK